MLLPDNIHPEHSIYFNGAIVLQVLQKQLTAQKLLDLFLNVKEERNMSFPVFVLCLDWLFLIDIIECNDNGDIRLCF